MNLWDESAWACCATLTPVDAKGAVDADRLAAHINWFIGQGMNGACLFGTCGEGPSFSARERLAATEALLARGIEPGRLVLGIGSCAIDDMALLAREAGRLGLAAALATPPFFYAQVGDEGIFRSYAAMIERAGPGAAPLLTYHIPQVAGVPCSHDVLGRLLDEFPEQVKGIKDSEANWEGSAKLLDRFASRATVLLGCEKHLPDAKDRGGKGTICGLANLDPALCARLVKGDRSALPEVDRLAGLFAAGHFVSVMKDITAKRTGDAGWRAVTPPLLPMAA